MGALDGLHDLLVMDVHDPAPQPLEQSRWRQAVPDRRPLFGDLAQHRVGQTGHAARIAGLAHQRDRAVDHTMRSLAKDQQLDRRDPQDIECGGRRAAVHEPVDDRVRSAKLAQYGDGQTLRAGPLRRCDFG